MNFLRKQYKKIALTLSIGLILLWIILGAGASLAWFSDSPQELHNIFHFADFELEVSCRQEDGSYKIIEADTKVFDENALYEPGYVEVVYLRVKNKGSVPFNFQTAVKVTDFTVATNVHGKPFLLQDYLKFGLITESTEEALEARLAVRDMAVAAADMPLGAYETDVAELPVGGTAYLAVIVRMPEAVSNDANYRGTVIPKVEMGLIVRASQQGG